MQIFGSPDIKKAIASLLFGGSRKRMPDGTYRRGDINVLLLGAWGAGVCFWGGGAHWGTHKPSRQPTGRALLPLPPLPLTHSHENQLAFSLSFCCR